MAGLFGSITVKGNRLTEFATQTASVGIPIPFGYGRFPCEGNIGFAPMPPKEHVKKKKQGKGGVKTEEYSYTLSYAIMFCEGPIFGYWTIKRNGKVVWTQDPNASVEDAAYAAKWAQKATFYYGTETQLPDSTIESYKGAGNVSAFRGIAYIVVEDDDVTDNGGAVPTYEAVVIASPPEAYLTSKPYPLYETDSIWLSSSFGTAIQRTLVKQTDNSDSMSVAMSFGTGTIRAPIVTLESLDKIQTSFTFGTGLIRAPLVSLGPQPPDEIQPSFTFGTGIIRAALISQEQTPEKIQTSFTFGTGSIYVP